MSHSHSDLRNRRGKLTEDSVKTTTTVYEETVATKLNESTTNSLQQLNESRQLHGAIPDAKEGYKLVPLVERSILMRLDVWPFILLYTLLIALDVYQPTVHNGLTIPWQKEYAIEVLFPLVLIGHVALFLLQQWRVRVRALVGYQETKSIDRMTHCLVEAPHVEKHHAAHDMEIVMATSEKGGTVIVKFRDIIFRSPTADVTDDADMALWSANDDDDDDDSEKSHENIATKSTEKDAKSRTFHRLCYPIQLPLNFYKKWYGHKSLASLVLAQQVYGPNTTPIELPPFLELLQEQTLAPFFLFQVLCVVLWSLDEYWYYAMFTLCALLLFESTVAYNRLHSLQRIRSHTMSHQRPIFVYRPGFPMGHNAWTQILVSELVPGDIVSCKQVASSRVPRNASHNLQHYQQQKQQHELKMNRIPADILILNGDAVVDEAMLTGESIPQLKVPLGDHSSATSGKNLDLQEHKEHILFGGTTLLVANAGDSSHDIPPSPDRGITGLILKTGFETAQGSLLRTMVHTQKSVDGLHTRDTYIFILILLCCAVASAAMVLQEGLDDPNRNRFRLVLHVIIIITSVVPPELPMELSLAVTNSVAALVKDCQVYCSEVFRIPLAGQVNICCFDKTGTLTSDEMQLTGVRYLDGNNEFHETVPPDSPLPWPVTRIMAACHSLALNSLGYQNANTDVSNTVGDPLEKAIMKDTGYHLTQNNAVCSVEPSPERSNTILIMRRFRFSSKLKRMSVLVREDTSNTTWVLSKGAPETMKGLLDPETIPSNYDEISMQHMASGQRVLAISYRKLSEEEHKGSLKGIQRETVESNLIFAGFLLLDCPIKPDSKSVISELWRSSHSCCMITGDALLTATSVARRVGIIRENGSTSPVLLQLVKSNFEATMDRELSTFSFLPIPCASGELNDDPFLEKLSLAELKEVRELVLAGQISICVNGDTLDEVGHWAVQNGIGPQIDLQAQKNEQEFLFHPAAQRILKELVPMVSVFARHAPRQKEAIIAAFNAGGYTTLMCGDGTNDVGALRRAHVGISLISSPEVEAKHRAATDALSRERAKQKKSKKGSGKRVKASSVMQESLRQIREAQDELENVELGDASIASPFTARTVSIMCCKDVLQQGRCTLVTMLQIYKILGVNCLVNATVLSKLFLHGVKNGDRQLTVLGIGVAVLFFFVTRGKPQRTLSPTRPPASVLCVQATMSISLQFLVHLGTILLSTQAALAFVDPYDPSMIPDGPFNPNTLNSCAFLLSTVATVNTFAVNYRGDPFTEPLRKNTLLLRSLQICYAILFGCALEVFPPLNDLFQLAEFPAAGDGDLVANGSISRMISNVIRIVGFPVFVSGLVAADTALVFAVEHVILQLFEPNSHE